MSTQYIEIQRFYAKLEQMLRQEVKDCFPYDWHEDYITRRIMSEYRKKFKTIQMLDAFSTSLKIESSSYKLTGKNENKFGDIAFIVRIQYPDKYLEGVAFLEAKKIHQVEYSFDAIRDEQLKRIASNAPHSSLLMYDHRPIHQYFPFLTESIFSLLEQYTHTAVIPINLVNSINEKNEKLYRFSLPFSYQIIFRYLRGLDLEFSPEALKIAKGYNRQLGTPQYVVVISVAYGEVNNPDFQEVNNNIFISIDSIDSIEF
ncbi:hypothetical protein [Iningainema tapete]|uniref:Uncharacterized protein n=1 Tax=Iningainema tapete BLCC-T55 TaxID=2748662 RepID=A0A8J7BXF2_9CYAN|nr:hypothetical protein [Iningainema tapete]MBD2773702.1 hypothetical protein [Iningainema tapete BLCC-T55]